MIGHGTGSGAPRLQECAEAALRASNHAPLGHDAHEGRESNGEAARGESIAGKVV